MSISNIVYRQIREERSAYFLTQNYTKIKFIHIGKKLNIYNLFEIINTQLFVYMIYIKMHHKYACQLQGWYDQIYINNILIDYHNLKIEWMILSNLIICTFISC